VDFTIARKRLEEMRDELDKSITYLEGPGSRDDMLRDSADAGSMLTEADRSEAILHSARNQRSGVLAALARIEQSRYGQCVDCDHEIPEGRLDALPDAARCVNCQAKHARRSRF
jgi:DnaK suppressor protein